jgi:hypothetical protein
MPWRAAACFAWDVAAEDASLYQWEEKNQVDKPK